MKNKLLKEYVSVVSEYRALDLKREVLRKSIVELFDKESIEKVEDADLGTFTLARRMTWTYTDAIKKIEEKVKIAKTKEQQKGLAKASETQYLLYKEPKMQ